MIRISVVYMISAIGFALCGILTMSISRNTLDDILAMTYIIAALISSLVHQYAKNAEDLDNSPLGGWIKPEGRN